jgi:hypothetical protein
MALYITQGLAAVPASAASYGFGRLLRRGTHLERQEATQPKPIQFEDALEAGVSNQARLVLLGQTPGAWSTTHPRLAPLTPPHNDPALPDILVQVHPPVSERMKPR